jgi:hypothetical protein
MEISEVRRRVVQTMEHARRAAQSRRARADEASREFEVFLQEIAVPLFRQVANVLKAEGQMFTLSTPAGSVRLMSERNADEFIDVSLDTSGDEPAIVGRSRRTRGRRVIDSERAIARGPIGSVTEDEVLAFVLEELKPLVEK